MERFNYWDAFASTGKVEDYLQYVSNRAEEEIARTEDYTNGVKNKGAYHQGTGNSGE